ncbi:MAG: hypothetical protein M3401_01440 [Actinomycetota bacterium]|nr:hypothetical protein [Actinomycetota bacterium]
MNELGDRRDDQRRSPVGDFMLSALWSANGKPVAHAQLLALAGERRVNVSQVLQWIAISKEGSLVEELTVDGYPALRLTPAGEEVVRNDRRRAERRWR